MSIMEGIARQDVLKKSKTLALASSRVAEFGGTLMLLMVNAIAERQQQRRRRSLLVQFEIKNTALRFHFSHQNEDVEN